MDQVRVSNTGSAPIVLNALIRYTALSLGLLLCQTAVAQKTPVSAPASAKTPGVSLGDPATERKIDALIGKMTLEEKVGQLVQYSIGQPTGPGTGRTDYADMLQKGQIGALFNITTAREANALQKIAVEKSRMHIPLIFGLDVIHGFRTEFPVPLGMASTWDPDLVEKAARIAAREASASGIRQVFSPMVDISRDPRWGRIIEGEGEDPFLVSAMACAYVRGYQGEKLNAPDSVAATVKHFVGYGAAEGGRDYNPVEISEHTLREYYLPPFRAAVEAGTASLMSGFNSLNGVPTSANPFTLTQILRKEWGFRGFVDSDWTSLAELVPHGIANDPATASRKAFLAGVDMDMVSSFYHDTMVKLVRSGQVPEKSIDEGVRRILRVKFALGLFERPYVDESAEAGAMLQPDSVATARKAAEESLVLLKNSAAAGGTALLPISADKKTVALIGPLGDDARNMMGSWSAQGDPKDVVTLKAALAERVGADHVAYAKGSEIIGGTEAQQSEAIEAAKKSDVVILALGEDGPDMTGEAASRAHLDLPGKQEQLLEAIVATGKPVVLIVFSGRPLTIPWAAENVSAIMAAWFPGVQAGPALVRTLYGEANPSGRLVVSWPRSVGQEPLYYNALDTGRPTGDADLTKPPSQGTIKYVSRYIDEQNTPQFPFGFGLSYTNIQYGPTTTSAKQLSAKALNAGIDASGHSTKAALKVSVDVTNSGSRATEETVQLYVRLEGTSVVEPVRALKGFQRVSIAPGTTQKVTFELGPEAFAFWTAQNRFAAEPSRLTVWAAPDSAHGTSTTLEIGE
jgi:beta-glucosidase